MLLSLGRWRLRRRAPRRQRQICTDDEMALSAYPWLARRTSRMARPRARERQSVGAAESEMLRLEVVTAALVRFRCRRVGESR